jgi:nicotinate-nucleotide adenylyltransferase
MTGIGVFGGTFDPVHAGHLLVARDSRVLLGLDTVLFVVAGDPWQKAGTVVASAKDRLAMVRLAVDGEAGLVVDDREVRRPGPSYMADTLAELAAEHPGTRLVLLLGADAAAGLDTWVRADEIRALAELAILPRAGEIAAPVGAQVLATPRVDVSSREIRARVAAGAPVDGLVPPAVGAYIRRRGLYRAGTVEPTDRPSR